MLLLTGGYKETRLNTGVLPPERVIETAIVSGARCVLREDEIGSIERGKKADLAIFNTRTPQWQPFYNPLSNLVYSATGGSADTVICDGKVLKEEGPLKTIDEQRIYGEVAWLAPGILKKTHLEEKVRPKWPVI